MNRRDISQPLGQLLQSWHCWIRTVVSLLEQLWKPHEWKSRDDPACLSDNIANSWAVCLLEHGRGSSRKLARARTVLPKLWLLYTLWRDLVRMQILNQQIWDEAWVSAFLTGNHTMLTWPVHMPHFEKEGIWGWLGISEALEPTSFPPSFSKRRRRGRCGEKRQACPALVS